MVVLTSMFLILCAFTHLSYLWGNLFSKLKVKKGRIKHTYRNYSFISEMKKVINSFKTLNISSYFSYSCLSFNLTPIPRK